MVTVFLCVRDVVVCSERDESGLDLLVESRTRRRKRLSIVGTTLKWGNV